MALGVKMVDNAKNGNWGGKVWCEEYRLVWKRLFSK